MQREFATRRNDMVGALLTGYIVFAPMLEVEGVLWKRMACRNTASFLLVMLETFSYICFKSALATMQTLLSFLFAMEFISSLNLKRKNVLRLRYFMNGKDKNWATETYFTVVDALVRLLASRAVSKFIKVSSEPSINYIMQAFASRYMCSPEVRPACAIQLAQGMRKITVDISFKLNTENGRCVLFIVDTFVMHVDWSEICSMCGACGFLEGPDTDVRWRSKETADWFIAAKNKDDDDDDDDDEGEEGGEEEDDDDGLQAGEEGEEDAEGEAGEEEDAGDEDDDEEEGEVDDEEEEEDGEEDEDEDDKDDDDDEESSQPPKKRRK